MTLSDDINALPAAPTSGATGLLGHLATVYAGLKSHDTRLTTVDTGYGKKVIAAGVTVYGETPWVDVTSMLSPAPSSGTLKMRRVGDWLHFDVAYLVYSTGVAPTLTLPGPWRTGLNAGALLLSSASTTVGRARLTYDGKLTLYYDTASSAPSCALSFPVQAGTAWPTSAPA